MFNFRQGWGRRAEKSAHRVRRRRGGGIHPLSDFMAGVEVTIISNRDRKTLEMGLCTGALIRVVENRSGDANLVIASGEGRYILSREAARHIHVR